MENNKKYIDNYTRFKDASWFPEETVNIIIGGAGGISSWTTLFLARAGFKPYVFDFDTVETHNLGGQIFLNEDVNKPKVEALKHIVEKTTNTSIIIKQEEYNENSISHNFMISGFDNMKARKDMFNNWLKVVKKWESEGRDVKNTPIFIDGRLLMENMQIFCVTPYNYTKYEDYLFDDSKVQDEPCTLKQTSHSAAMIASHMVGFFTNHYHNCLHDVKRQVPFMLEYFIPLNYLKYV